MEDEAAAADAAEQATPSVSVTTPAPTNPGAVVARRTTLPADMFDRSNVSLWTVIKDFVGKDLSKIAVPVYFNEPLSFLQKFSEDVEYHYLLDEASRGTLHINILCDRSVATADQGLGCATCAPSSGHAGGAAGVRGGVRDLALLGDHADGQAVQPDPGRDV